MQSPARFLICVSATILVGGPGVSAGSGDAWNEVSFASPLVAEGLVEITLSGRLLLVIESGGLHFNVSWPGSLEARNHTRIEAHFDNLVSDTKDRELPSHAEWQGSNLFATASARSEMATVEVVSSSITMRVLAKDLQGHVGSHASCWGNLVDHNADHYKPWRERGPACLPGAVGWRLEPNMHQTVYILSSDLDALEVQGVDWSCKSTCPPGGGVHDMGGGSTSLTGVDLMGRSFIELAGPTPGQITVAFSGGVVYAASIHANLSLDGVVRLPGYEGPGADPDGDQTLRAAGTMALHDIQMQGEQRFAASWLAPDIVMLDETISANQAAAAVAGATILAVLAKILAGALAGRSASPLTSPRRRQIMAYITAHPGATFRELVRGTEIPAGTARHHVAVLKQANLIMEKPHNQTLRYFENHGKFEDSWNSVVLLREPELNSLHSWLLRHDGATQKEVLAWAEGEGWSRSTAQHRLKRLETEGLVLMRPMGRWKCYTARKRAPVPS